MLQELDPSVVADVTTCVLQYQELDPNVVAGVVADCTTHPFKRAQADWLFIPSIMILPRRDRPGQVSPRLIIPGPRMRVACCQCSSDIHESRGAHACFRCGYRVWCSMVPIRRLSDATPIARGKIPLTIPILIAGIGACAKDRRLCPTFASANVSPCSTLCCCPVRDSCECTIECAHIHWAENHDLSVLPPFAYTFHK